MQTIQIEVELEGALIIKGLAAYLLWGSPTEEEKKTIIRVLDKVEKASSAIGENK